MNNAVFQQAQAAYNAKDFGAALQLYSACMQDASAPLAPGESGLLCHQMGNCLMKLGNCAEAINAYSQATGDTAYDAQGAVNCNLGVAYAQMRDYEDAVKYFSAAATDGRYDARYKANSGMGSALLKLGKTAEAGVAFREAALDEANPDPTKSLLNLGICFMTLNRPSDAVTSYESALQFPMQAETRNKLYANLGQAYVACGQMQKAVNAFEAALADKTYFLSDSASVDYQRAVGNVAQGTMEIPAVGEETYADASGFDVVSDEYDTYNNDQELYEPSRYDDDYYPLATNTARPVAAGGQNDAFANASAEEVESWARNLEVQKKKRHGIGFKLFIVFLLLLIAGIATAAVLYYQGYGYPSQETVLQEFFNDPASASSVMASGVTEDELAEMAVPVVSDSNVTIDGINKSMTNSTAYVTAKTSEGGEVKYVVTLVRDGLAWKISNVELFFNSQN